MSRYFNKYCSICGDKVTSSSYCDKHNDYSNHPDSPTQKNCTWCGRNMNVDDNSYECNSCQEEEERVNEKMRKLANDYNSRRADETPDWQWANCPNCGLYTVNKRLYMRSGSFLDIITGGHVVERIECKEMRCQNCFFDHVI